MDTLRSIANSQDQPGETNPENTHSIKLLISPLPEIINKIYKKYSLENSQDKKSSDDT